MFKKGVFIAYLMFCIGFSVKGQEVEKKEKIKWSVNVAKGKYWHISKIDKTRSTEDTNFVNGISKKDGYQIGIGMRKNRFSLNLDYQKTIFRDCFSYEFGTEKGSPWNPMDCLGQVGGDVHLTTLKTAYLFSNYDNNQLFHFIPNFGIQWSKKKCYDHPFSDLSHLSVLPQETEVICLNKNGFNLLCALDLELRFPYYENWYFYSSFIYSKGLIDVKENYDKVRDSEFFTIQDNSHVAALLGLKFTFNFKNKK